MTPTVHVLAYGRVLCGNVHGIPCDWGPQHRWVSAFGEEWKRDATCALCRNVAELLHVVRRINYGERHEVMLPPAGPDEENPLSEQLREGFERGLSAEQLEKVRADSVTNAKMAGPDDGVTEQFE